MLPPEKQLRNLKTRHPVQANVHENELWREIQVTADGRGTIGGMANHVDPGYLVKVVHDGVCKRCVVFHQENTQGRFRALG